MKVYDRVISRKRLGWMFIDADKRALALCTPQTKRAMWELLYQHERMEQGLLGKKLIRGKIGTLYGVTIYP